METTTNQPEVKQKIKVRHKLYGGTNEVYADTLVQMIDGEVWKFENIIIDSQEIKSNCILFSKDTSDSSPDIKKETKSFLTNEHRDDSSPSDIHSEIKKEIDKDYNPNKIWYCRLCDKNLPSGDWCMETHFGKIHPKVKPIWFGDRKNEKEWNWDCCLRGCGKDIPTRVYPTIWSCVKPYGSGGYLCDDCKLKFAKDKLNEQVNKNGN